jgi:diguanylate cyclase (GGDEF)-like protein
LLVTLLCSLSCGRLLAAPGTTPDPLAITGSGVDLWPAVTVLADPTHRLVVADVLSRIADFKRPTEPYSNFGPARHTLWVRASVRVPEGGPPDWWFTANYAPLDRIDLHVVHEGRVLSHQVLGDHLRQSERPVAARTHVAALSLPPGQAVELLLRVRSTGILLLPLSLRQTAQLMADESALQVWHGMALGFGVCVLAFALTGVLTSRGEPLYVWFAWSVASGSLFFFSYFGLAAELFWPENRWLIQNASPLLILLVLVGGFTFAERALDVRSLSPRIGRLMNIGAALSMGVALLFMAGVIDYGQASAAAGLIGPWPMLLSLPVAIRRARVGDRAARWTLAGWVIYSAGVVTSISLSSGLAPATTAVQQAYLVSAMLQIVAWLMVMNVRVAQLREQALTTQRENDRMLLLSQTDPLTGLLNRRGLQLGLEPLVTASRPGHLTAVYLLDLDGFKPVNDRLGHDAGDELLVQLGTRLRQAVRGTDLVSRLGGDEFVVVAARLAGEQEAELVGQKLLACTDADFVLRDGSCRVGITVGYAIAPRDGADAAQLLRRADAAMYGGKQEGKGRVRRATPEAATS